jgi:tetratricopeptide (TPR) repeat protein
VSNAEKIQTSLTSHAINLILLALAQHQLRNVDESKHALDKAEQFIAGQGDAKNGWILTHILLREAQTLIDDRPVPSLVARLAEIPYEKDVAALVKHDRLLNLANAADSNLWRIQLRTALMEADLPKLKEMAMSDEIRTQSPELIAWLSDVLKSAGAAEVAEAVLREAQARHPSDFWLNYELGVSLNQTEHNIEGIGFVRAALATRPDSSGTLWHLALRLREVQKPVESIRVFQQLKQLQPNNFWVLYNYGAILLDQGKLDEAISEFREAIEVDPKHAWGHRNLGIALVKQNKLEEAITEFRKAIELEPNDVLSRINIGGTLYSHGKVDEAIVELEQAIQIDPKHAEAHNQLGWALMLRGDLEQSVAILHKAIELDPKQATFYNSLGVTLRKQGKFGEATAQLLKSLEVNPKFDPASRNLITTLKEQKKDEEAIAAYRKAIKLSPDNLGLRLNLAKLLSFGTNEKFLNPGEAVLHAQEAIRIKPEDAKCWVILGVAHFRTGDWQAARDTLQQSVDLGGNHPSDLIFLAMTHWQLDDQTEARKWYAKALAWREKNKPEAELQEFYKEAEKLLDGETEDKKNSADQKADQKQKPDPPTVKKNK